MIAPFATRSIATWTADIRALWQSWGSKHGGWRGAWRDTAEFARHRQIVIETFRDTERVLLTRIRLSGEIETCVRRSWLNYPTPRHVNAKIEEHFAKVTAAVTGWPASLGMTRLGSRIAGLGGLVLAARQVIQDLLTGGSHGLLHTAWTNWPLLAGPALVAIGFAGGPILRPWLRASIGRAPIGAPAQS